MGSANERRRYYVTPSVIGRAYPQNIPLYFLLLDILDKLYQEKQEKYIYDMLCC